MTSIRYLVATTIVGLCGGLLAPQISWAQMCPAPGSQNTLIITSRDSRFPTEVQCFYSVESMDGNLMGIKIYNSRRDKQGRPLPVLQKSLAELSVGAPISILEHDGKTPVIWMRSNHHDPLGPKGGGLDLFLMGKYNGLSGKARYYRMSVKAIKTGGKWYTQASVGNSEYDFDELSFQDWKSTFGGGIESVTLINSGNPRARVGLETELSRENF